MKGFCLKPSIALNQKRTEIRELVAKFPTLNPRVFGSVVFGNDKEGSDLDLLVDTLPGLTLFDLGALQYELEEMLGVSVDLLTPGDLPMKFRNLVLAQAQAVWMRAVLPIIWIILSKLQLKPVDLLRT